MSKLFLIIMGASPVVAIDNSLGLKPPLGWRNFRSMPFTTRPSKKWKMRWTRLSTNLGW